MPANFIYELQIQRPSYCQLDADNCSLYACECMRSINLTANNLQLISNVLACQMSESRFVYDIPDGVGKMTSVNYYKHSHITVHDMIVIICNLCSNKTVL